MSGFRTLLLALIWASACSSASFQQGVYDDGVVRYRIGEPGAGWDRVDVDDNDLAFHRLHFGTMSINSTCSDYEDVPKQALVNHLLFGTTERRFQLEETVTLDGRGARHVIVDLELDGVPLSLEIYLVKKDGCVYDLVHTAARDDRERGREAFATFVGGFRVLETRLP